MLHSFDQLQLNKNATSENLMIRVKERDETALSELLRRHTPVLRIIVGRIINNDGDIDDLIQEVFLQVWDRAGNYSKEKGPALGWIITIARCRAIDKVRKKQSYFRMQERIRLEPKGETYQHTREEAHSRDMNGIFKKLLAQLPAAQREAIHLSYYCDLSQREIAVRTGIPLGTIKTRLQLAVTKIRISVLAFEDFKAWWPSHISKARLTV